MAVSRHSAASQGLGRATCWPLRSESEIAGVVWAGGDGGLIAFDGTRWTRGAELGVAAGHRVQHVRGPRGTTYAPLVMASSRAGVARIASSAPPGSPTPQAVSPKRRMARSGSPTRPSATVRTPPGAGAAYVLAGPRIRMVVDRQRSLWVAPAGRDCGGRAIRRPRRRRSSVRAASRSAGRRRLRADGGSRREYLGRHDRRAEPAHARGRLSRSSTSVSCATWRWEPDGSVWVRTVDSCTRISPRRWPAARGADTGRRPRHGD